MNVKRPGMIQKVMSCLLLAVMLTSCQRTVQFSYDPAQDPFQAAEEVMDSLVKNYNTEVERMMVVALAFNGGTGILQEHQLYDFSTIQVQTVPGGKVIVSLPKDSAGDDTWTLVRNESKTSSRPFLPMVVQTKPGMDYERLNFLLEPVSDTDVTAVLEDQTGNRKMTFRISIRGAE